MAVERRRLNLSLESLFPGETVTIGDQAIEIRPLGILRISCIAKKLKALGELLGKQGVTWENYNESENLFKVAITLLENFPDVLEEASDIHIDDLRELPIDCIVEILDTVFKVNLKSKDKLEGNFKSLVERLKITPLSEKSPQKSTNTK